MLQFRPPSQFTTYTQTPGVLCAQEGMAGVGAKQRTSFSHEELRLEWLVSLLRGFKVWTPGGMVPVGLLLPWKEGCKPSTAVSLSSE